MLGLLIFYVVFSFLFMLGVKIGEQKKEDSLWELIFAPFSMPVLLGIFLIKKYNS
jgi:hypothetical protein